MDAARDYRHDHTMTLGKALRGTAILVLAGAMPIDARAQQTATATTSLVFDGVTVVDVERGKLIPYQRVVIEANRIRAMGDTGAVQNPKNAQVVDARGKYLIPGLWDMHTHSLNRTDLFYPLFIANGITGIRDAGSFVLLDTLKQWRREIVAGLRVGPPRQLLSGPPINGDAEEQCIRKNNVPPGGEAYYYTCVSADSADARRLVDSLRALGVDMLKTYHMTPSTYFALAAAARRAAIDFGGHVETVSALDVTDSGASIIDHLTTSGGLDTLCTNDAAGAARCQLVADRFRRHNTWFVPTLVYYDWDDAASTPIRERLEEYAEKFWARSPFPGNWLRDSTVRRTADSLGLLRAMQHANLPILAGTDAVSYQGRHQGKPPGFSLHAELAMEVAEGLTPLNALQSATLNPAKMLQTTDSLGTVAAGKLADLVLLDANPLDNITNTTTIRAVVANGRYFDRAALDGLLAKVQANGP